MHQHDCSTISPEQQPPSPEPTAGLPALRLPGPSSTLTRRRRRPGWPICAALIVSACVAGGVGWWHDHHGASELPGFAWSQGRLKINEVDIDTKFAGAVATILVDEGDTIHKGQVLARMDTRALQVGRQEAEEKVQEARQEHAATLAALDQQRSLMLLDQQQFQRSLALVPPGFESREALDERRQAMTAAIAGYQRAEAEVNAATAELEVAKNKVIKIDLEISESTLVAPVDGRIQYRLANQGEVLGAGARVFTMLDTNNVYMDVLLPMSEGSRVAPHNAARILLDAWPGRIFPALVLFVDPWDELAPKTAADIGPERDNLTYRVRVRIDPIALRAEPDITGSGQPGLVYIKTDRSAAWPAIL